MAPKLTTDTGDTVLDSLSSAEIEELRSMGVEIDADLDGGSDPDGADAGSGSGDADPDDDSAETPGDETDSTGDPDAEHGDETVADPEAGGDDEAEGDDGDGTTSGDGDTKGGVEGKGDADGMSTGDGRVDPEVTGEELPDHDLESRDLSDEIAEEYHTDMDSVREPDERDKIRWESLLEELSQYGDNVEQRKREREERIGHWPVKRDGESIRADIENSPYVAELEEGFRKLVSRPTPRPARSGPEIDMMNVTRRASGDMTVRELFKERVRTETGDRCIGFCTDISGSMGSDMVDLKKAGALIATATDIIGDAFVWEAFTDEDRGGLDLRIVTGPQEEFAYRQLDSFTAEGNEPTAAGIRDCRMLMEQTTKRDYVMIVVTDGKALVGEDGTYYGGSHEPIADARAAVKECRDHGVDVIGMGIGGMSDHKMQDTFGEGNYKLTSIEELADDIIELYEEQMNVSRRR